MSFKVLQLPSALSASGVITNELIHAAARLSPAASVRLFDVLFGNQVHPSQDRGSFAGLLSSRGAERANCTQRQVPGAPGAAGSKAC